jgi:hypothetical protein
MRLREDKKKQGRDQVKLEGDQRKMGQETRLRKEKNKEKWR